MQTGIRYRNPPGPHVLRYLHLCARMGQKKLHRFAEIGRFDHVFEYTDQPETDWGKFFGNEHPLTLELACGKGEYTTGLAAMYPHRNFVGVDVKGNRIWVGARTALREGRKNVAFLRSQMERIGDFFRPQQVSEIWITFPDPQLRHSRQKKRLTHPRYLRIYQSLLKPGAPVHLKTDSPVMYAFTLKVIEMYGLTLLAASEQVYESSWNNAELQIKTHFEGLDISGSSRIHYIRFLIDVPLRTELDELLKQHIVEGESTE